MLINGSWARDFHPVHDTDDEGGFVRSESLFRNWITPDGQAGPSGLSGFKAEADRYHLYVGLICPWACRTLMVRELKGLNDLVSISVVDPRLGSKVWRFGGYPGATEDHLYGNEYLYQLYLKAKADYTGEVTIPVLWDKKQQTIVSNESSEIIRMFNDGFGELADDRVDLYPPPLRSEIDQVNKRLYQDFNNGVYRCGFATTQIAYEHAVEQVFDSLDYMDKRLQRQPYLVGDQITEADIRAFVTLIRFDVAYYALFKANLRQVRDYPNLIDYMRRIYALPGIAETVNIKHIKAGYYSIRALNPSGIVPLGPASIWEPPVEGHQEQYIE